MSDFESRLGRALVESAEDAPGAGGLADGARRRSGVRRRRRLSVGAAMAVLAVVVPLAVVQGDGEVPSEQGVVDVTEDGWQRVVLTDEVSVDVPEDWGSLEIKSCRGPAANAFGPAGTTCEEGARVSAFVGDIDIGTAPGAIDDGGGYVALGRGAYVFVSGTDTVTARRVLASAGDPDGRLDLAGPWTSTTVDGVDVDVPGEPVDVVGTVDGPDRKQGAVVVRGRQGEWQATRAMEDGTQFEVVAPTVALAQVVVAAARTSDVVPDTTSGWQTVEHAGVAVDVPAGWLELDPADCLTDRGFEVGLPRPATSGLHPCDATTSITITADAPDRDAAHGLVARGGDVRVVDQLVAAANVDHETARRVLASARPAGTDPVDLTSWGGQVLGEDLVVQVPDDPAVQVLVDPADPSCRRPASRSSASYEQGVWRADYCGSRIVRITAPTQALADVVASTITELEWQVVRVGDTQLDVPAGWVADPGCAGAGPPLLFGPEDAVATPCTEVAGVFLLDSMADSPLDLDRPGGPCVTPPEGGCAVQPSGDDVVYVRGVPSGSIQRVVDSIQPVR